MLVSPIRRKFFNGRLAALACSTLFASASTLQAEDSGKLYDVVFKDDVTKQERNVKGRILVRARDGGILLEDRRGRLWNVTPEQIQKVTKRSEAFTAVSAKELESQLQVEFGAGFRTSRTRHYVVCANTSRAYADWCGTLLDRVYSAFLRHWKDSGLELHEPDFPLCAIVFAKKSEFAQHATKADGPSAASGSGYFSVRSNRILLFDLTSVDSGGAAGSGKEIVRRLARVPFNVATVVHEATHQVAFNTGMHTRYADNPMWLTEGMAMYFETPEHGSRTSVRGIGRRNPWRWQPFTDYMKDRRGADSLRTLLKNDKRFQNETLAADAYAEAWALTWFLIRTRREAYEHYLQRIASKPRLIWDEADERIADFETSMGVSLEELDADFMKYMRRLRR